MEKRLISLLAGQKVRSSMSGLEHLGTCQKSGRVNALQGQVIVSENPLLLITFPNFTSHSMSLTPA